MKKKEHNIVKKKKERKELRKKMEQMKLRKTSYFIKSIETYNIRSDDMKSWG
jgi:hypothetical protein